MLLYSQVKAISLPDVNGWIRPYDWIQIPNLVNNSQVFYGLVAVFPTDANFITVRATGAYTVNWGDGTIENYGTNVIAYKNYNFSSLSSTTTTSEGFRQALITITPQSGSNLVSVSLSNAHNQVGLIALTTTGLLEAAVNSPNLTTFSLNAFSGTPARHRYLKKLTIGQNLITSLTALFNESNSLESFVCDLSSVTDISRMFQNSSIKVANYFGNANNITNAANLFNGCNQLKQVGALKVSAVSSTANLSSIFSGCINLARAQIFGARFSFSVASCSLSQAALVEIFNNLGTASGSQTITISGNYGASALTTAERQIATNKGWTITG